MKTCPTLSTEIYTTLSFKTVGQANKALLDISSHFKNRLVDSEILKGTDERGNYGFYVKYSLSKFSHENSL